jgi:hypothetical protein
VVRRDPHLEFLKEQMEALKGCGVVLGKAGLELAAADGVPLNREGRRAVVFGLSKGEDEHTACLAGLTAAGVKWATEIPVRTSEELARW